MEVTPGRGPRNVRLPGNWLFQTEDAAISELLRESARSRGLRAMERFGFRLIAVVAAAFLAVWALWRFGVPALVTLAIHMTPPPVIKAMDSGALRTLDATIARPSALPPAQRNVVRRIFTDLQTALPETARPSLTLKFRHMPGMGPNALALPGGTVVLTDALVREFAEDPDVIAGVLGHEIGHVVERHGLRQVYTSLSVYILVALIAGDVGPILEETLLEGQLFLSLSFSRAHERAADTFGLRLTRAAGYDPAGLARFFRSIVEHDTPSDWYSSHPLSSERIENVERFIEDTRRRGR